jgi:GH24 family phage-related lysozyme (muramidase)
MKVSDKGLELIKRYEGLELAAYADPGSKGEPYTIGYGHTSMAGPPAVHRGMRISMAEAVSILKSDLGKFETAVSGLLTRTPTQNQFDAMVSLCFNIGPKNFASSTVLRRFNAGDFVKAANGFMLFTKASGHEMKGLIARRSAEMELFRAGSVVIVPVSDTPAPDREDIIDEPKPVLKQRKVWTNIVSWVGGGGVASFAAFSGFDWRTMLVIVAAIMAFVLFFWFQYRREIAKGLFEDPAADQPK